MAFFVQTGQTPMGRLSEQLGQAIGKGAAKTFPDPQVLVQRGMLQDAFSKVRGIASNKNSSPLDVALGLMEATAGIPGSERYLSTLLPQLLQAQQFSGMPDLGGGQSQGQQASAQQGSQMPQPQGMQGQPMQQGQAQPMAAQGAMSPFAQGPQQQQQEGQQQNYMPQEGAGIQLGTYLPLDMGAYISPEQQSSIIKSSGAKGADTNLVKQYINDYNKGLIDYNELLNANVDRQSAQIQKQLGLEKQAKSFIDTQLSPNIPEERKNIYYDKLKRELKTSPDMTTAWQKVSKDIQAFEKQVEEFPDKIPEYNPYGIDPGKERMLSQSIKNIIEEDPLAIPIFEKMFTQQGHPITAAARVINPLPEKISSVLGGAKDYREYIYPKYGMSERNIADSVREAESLQFKESKKLAKTLKKDWNDNLSLINMYTDLKVKGWLPRNIHTFFEDLEKEGVKLSPYQQSERTQLLNPPKIPMRLIKWP